MKKLMSLLGLLMVTGSAIAMQAPHVFKSLKPHNGKVASVSLVEDATVVTGSADGSVKLVLINNGQTNFEKTESNYCIDRF